MFKNKKYFFVLIGVIVTLLFLGTFAWWQWSSSVNANVYGEGCAPEISFAGGSTINGTDLLPVLSYSEGLSKNIIVTLQDRCVGII